MTAPIEQRASHVDSQWDDVLSLLHGTIGAMGQLRHIGHYTNGCNDLMVGRVASADTHKRYARMAREFSLLVSDLEAELVPLCTGSLIRVLLQSRAESAHCCSVVPDQHVVAFTEVEPEGPDVPLPEVSTVLAADRLLSDLVTNLRQRLGLRHQNPGGWLTERLLDDTDDTPVGGTSPLRVEGHASASVVQLCRQAIGPRKLHYVAWCENNRITCSVDDFEDPRLDRFVSRIEPSERRLLYRALCGRFPVVITQLLRAMSGRWQAELNRVVLDVEEGAIYYYWVRPGAYVIGVTLDQDEVAQADAVVARLGTELASS